MGREARRSADAYSWDRHFSKIHEIYEEVREAKLRANVKKNGLSSS
jgi:hypothetical protein